jgi:hypothetical protein
VPRNALNAEFCWNLYLNAIDFLIEFPTYLEILSVEIPIALFMAKHALGNALEALLLLEKKDKENRKLENETFRSSTPAVLLLQKILAREPLQAFKTAFLDAMSAQVKRYSSWTLQAQAEMLDYCFAFLQQSCDALPELSVILFSLDRLNNPVFQESVFFLRFICPALVQTNNRSLIDLAKTLQLIANHIDPSSDSAQFGLLEKIQFHRTSMKGKKEKILNQSI